MTNESDEEILSWSGSSEGTPDNITITHMTPELDDSESSSEGPDDSPPSSPRERTSLSRQLEDLVRPSPSASPTPAPPTTFELAGYGLRSSPWRLAQARRRNADERP